MRVGMQAGVEAAKGERRHALVTLEEAPKVARVAEAAGVRDLVDVPVVVQQKLARIAEAALVDGLRQGVPVDLVKDATQVVGVALQGVRQADRGKPLMEVR